MSESGLPANVGSNEWLGVTGRDVRGVCGGAQARPLCLSLALAWLVFVWR